MQTISGRIPDDLYDWLATLQVDGAVTSSDKLRVLLGQLKRQDEGAQDYVSAQSWFRELTRSLRASLTIVDRDDGVHSEVVMLVAEHVSSLAATLVSSRPTDLAAATALEAVLVRRVMALAEAVLRQGVTNGAAAFDPAVVRGNVGRVAELARLPAFDQGEMK